MDKKVLAIYYSQSGQLGEIMDNFTTPLIKAGVSVEKVRINLAKNFPFPWTADSFFGVMPDSVLGLPAELAPFEVREKEYDLIILGYQAWFLSPSIPINSLLRNKAFQELIYGTPVIAITGARNMWLNAFMRVKASLKASKAKLVGNIALVDRHPNPISFVTIFHWMFHGKKDRYLGIFPRPGVSDSDIRNCSVLGTRVLPFLRGENWNGLQMILDEEKAVELNYNLLVIESVAVKIFTFWANFIINRKNKAFWLKIFKYYLLFAFFIGAPIVLAVDAVFFRLFSPNHVKAKREYFLKLN